MKRVRIGEKLPKVLILLDFSKEWLQIGCKILLPVCCRNNLNKYNNYAAEKSAAFTVSEIMELSNHDWIIGTTIS